MALLLFFLTLVLIPEPCCYGQALITLNNKNNKKQEEERHLHGSLFGTCNAIQENERRVRSKSPTKQLLIRDLNA